MKAFFDTNVCLYAVTSDSKKARADQVIAQGGVISAQVLNEFTNVARNKLRHGWAEIEYAIARFLTAFDAVLPLTTRTHAAALALARDHRMSFYDALIVAAALEAGCDTLWTEDMQDGSVIGALTIRNPF